MIGYVTIGTNNLEKSKAFYDALLAELGGKRAFASDRMQGYSNGQGPMVAICTPYDGKAAQPGNGNMVSLAAPDRPTVDKVHAKAMSLGAKDEGAPGERMPTFYGAYFRDPDGNKFCVFKSGK
ncbi:MAG: VOC family protein [Proteobacteria bacterium]|nr:VOC family protein [Pseudomonadota bacterium]